MSVPVSREDELQSNDRQATAQPTQQHRRNVQQWRDMVSSITKYFRKAEPLTRDIDF